MGRSDEIIRAFRIRGLKVTPQRVAIVKALLEIGHPTAEEVYEAVKKEHPYISLATVYRTLKTLSRSGLVKELCLPNGATRYDSNIKPHVNIVCVGCGRIVDYESEDVEGVVSRIADKIKTSGYKVLGFRLDVDVYCDSCRK
jgi:Fur family peroxide stress response transcriptional regulator